MSVNRRVWLLGGGAIMLAGLALVTPPAREAICSGPTEAYRLALARLGEACVGCNPEMSPEVVMRSWDKLNGETDAALLARVTDDFAAGQIVEVDGWQLARTEALIYAAAYYEQGQGGAGHG